MARIRNPLHRPTKETFHALTDVSFGVKRGEVLGIIGRNGAGKSTLLKIISRITEPTAGEIKLYGRVASLLEVGTGFHPELTGRENIYLNGAILGMRQSEIERKYDEIVAFSEVGNFLDTPVKRYSSGMYVRLAFAVAAHLDPEILIVDEVLAVGDVRFQRKCLGKMHEVTAGGQRTVLFVSHNMAAIQSLCSRALLLEGGRISHSGDVQSVVSAYAALPRTIAPDRPRGSLATGMDGVLELHSLGITTPAGQSVATAICGNDLAFEMTISSHIAMSNITALIALKDRHGTRVLLFNSSIAGYDLALFPGTQILSCSVPRFPLTQGLYTVEVKILKGAVHLLWCAESLDLTVEPGDFFGSGRLPEAQWAGFCQVPHQWAAAPCPSPPHAAHS